MCYIFSNNVRILSVYDSYLMGITYEYFHIISLRGGPQKQFNPATFFEVPIPSQESEWSCIFTLVVSILPHSTIFSIGFLNCSDSVVFLVYARVFHM